MPRLCTYIRSGLFYSPSLSLRTHLFTISFVTKLMNPKTPVSVGLSLSYSSQADNRGDIVLV